MPRTDLRDLFVNLQDELLAQLGGARALPHFGVQGEVSEESWLRMLQNQLPRRYRVSRAMVIDCEGETSDQIDLVIHDLQYSPLLFQRGQQRFVPAESVYAVLEVKQVLDAETLRYAGEKAASVRRLRRTNARFPHAGGRIDDPKPPFEILAGIVSHHSTWTPAFGETFLRNLVELPERGYLQLGCALRDGAFTTHPVANDRTEVEVAPPATALVFFFVSLLQQLQRLGTVPAIDYTAYRRVLA